MYICVCVIHQCKHNQKYFSFSSLLCYRNSDVRKKKSHTRKIFDMATHFFNINSKRWATDNANRLPMMCTYNLATRLNRSLLFCMRSVLDGSSCGGVFFMVVVDKHESSAFVYALNQFKYANYAKFLSHSRTNIQLRSFAVQRKIKCNF